MIRTRTDDRVRVVTIDRPERRNALRPEDLAALQSAVTSAAEPVTYLHGAGDAFCAGADLDVVAGLDSGGDSDGDDGPDGRGDADVPESFARRGQRAAAAIETADTVVVCGIDGAARGGGVELALAADVRVATPAATFAEPGVSFGLFGTWGGTVRLPRVMREGNALEFALSGRVFDADEALRTGLVSRVVDDPREVADAIATGKPDALRTVKRRVRDRRDEETQERAEAEAFAALVRAHGDEIAAARED
ncbi:enoyl-CoA hydratase/isomerase family protein [Halorubrum sp. AD140]|uniref:enoyl-CoA hydratase/isomerase family protein n=1 Tax=Halorubrum sp. AD140 TaxID=3050073 RepID=UPI002ACCD0C3|nr:enoyl-CoA hydratase/isomerase family protein [Halorubrum sp. AD140]MDZ5809871.1 enoyl-CoA hydratase/isomerase family protein [Halorubrum sp. AD140]